MCCPGNPYPADIQRLVPGREHLSDKELLVPQENIAGPMSPPVQPRPGSATARRSVEGTNSGNPPGSSNGPVNNPVSNIDALIEELAVRGFFIPPVNQQHFSHTFCSPRQMLVREAPPQVPPLLTFRSTVTPRLRGPGRASPCQPRPAGSSPAVSGGRGSSSSNNFSPLSRWSGPGGKPGAARRRNSTRARRRRRRMLAGPG